MVNSKYAVLLALLALTACSVGFIYFTGSTFAFVLSLMCLALLFVLPWLFNISFDVHKRLRGIEREEKLAKVKILADQQNESAKLLIRRDLELTRANEQLRALDQLKTDFVMVATHQLRTPLTAIRWILSMLLREDFGALNDEQKTHLLKAYESNNRMVQLLSNMLISEKVGSEKLRPDPGAATMFPDLADNVLTEIKPLAEKHGVQLFFDDRKESYPKARIDPKNMRAILQNLLENAIKYTNAGGSVKLSIREQAGSLVCAVADTGIGIPLGQQKNIFKRFFRAPNAVKAETDGSGLGLYIVKSIVEKFKGEISFESKENQGTIFRVVLPIVSAVAA